MYLDSTSGPPPSRGERRGALLAALGLSTACLAGIAALQGWTAAAQAAGYLAASAAGVGKLIIFAALTPESRLSAWELAGIATTAEVAVSAILVWHIDLLYRVPRLGARLERVRAMSAEALAANPRWRRWASVGVGLYTALPFSGTGPLGSTFFGQMAGLSRRATLVGICGGSVASSALMAWGALTLRGRMESLVRHPAMTVAGVLLTLALVAVLGRAMRTRN